MEKTVFGDLLFFVNFCMDFQCLFLTARLIRRPFPVLRSVIFAALGAAYAVAALFFETSGPIAFLLDCFVCLLMCAGTFWGRGCRPRRILIAFLIYFGVSFAVGGVMSGTAALLSHLRLPLGPGGTDVSSGLFFILAAVGGLSTFFWGRFCQYRGKGARATLTLSFDSRKLSVRCLVDTANLLRDPVGGRPVAVLSQRAAEKLLPAELLSVCVTGDPSGLSQLPAALAKRVRLIPGQSVTGKKLLLAIAPDYATVDLGKGEMPRELLVAPVPLAVDLDDYEALLPAVLITE